MNEKTADLTVVEHKIIDTFDRTPMTKMVIAKEANRVLCPSILMGS